jgi:hypothetical protein
MEENMKISAGRLMVILCGLAVFLPATTPQATVIMPNGGEDLPLGTEYIIAWNCSNCAVNAHITIAIFNILHSGPGYQGQISLAGIPMNQGFFKWPTVGKLIDGTFVKPGPGYKIRLEAVAGSDTSDGTFSIVEKKIKK